MDRDPAAPGRSGRYTRIYSDAAGGSHFQEVRVGLRPRDFAPPAAPLDVAQLSAASRCFFVSGPPDWEGAVPHPSPQRQFFSVMQGDFELTVSDGETRRFGPGSLVLLDDTHGEGHSTRIVGGSDFLIFGVAV